MKRYHFKGMFASHGTERKHRSPGSIGSLCSNRGYGGGLARARRWRATWATSALPSQPGRGPDRAGAQPAPGEGPVPGRNDGMVMVRPAIRLYKSKAKKVAAREEVGSRHTGGSAA
jgi:large subunit ribosomal protein L3